MDAHKENKTTMWQIKHAIHNIKSMDRAGEEFTIFNMQ